ncbi:MULTISPECIES: hypothetical protein [unclassified Streptomyces]|uniref:hypothetical protein n=1 Tax=unclassified Streptomyces TaxID=2593676 RepID=UPI00081E06CC|nr:MULTISPECIES: hypothetical protein [unclassified Streptomyces]MYR93597.1 hypothetical protein [Streptomyces sp. SID4937]SCD55799.1 hypothetical protein GA0115243_103136 [Streptomyces sp. ScaeMP-e83]
MNTTAPLFALLAIFLIVFGTIVFVVRRFESTPVRVAVIISAIATLVTALVPLTRTLMEPPPEAEANQALVSLAVIVAIYVIVFGTIAYVVDRLKSRPARIVAVIVGIGTLIGSLVPVARIMSEPTTQPAAARNSAASWPARPYPAFAGLPTEPSAVAEGEAR